MEFLTDDLVAQTVTYQRVTLDARHHAAAATAAPLLDE